MSKLTNQTTLGSWGGALKRQELKQGILDRGGIQCCRTGQCEKTGVYFFCIKVAKPIMVVTQNKMMNLHNFA